MKSWPYVASKQLQSRKKYNKNIETLLAKAKFFPPYLRQAAKIYVSTSYSVVRQETIEISEQRTAFVWFFAQEVNWCMKDCDKQRLQTTVSINLWKILAGHTGDWFDVKTASICTTELWDALKSFILTSLKFKVAAYPIIVSLDTLRAAGLQSRSPWPFNVTVTHVQPQRGLMGPAYLHVLVLWYQLHFLWISHGKCALILFAYSGT